eukprot:scaffold1750_cov108-Cylindrotheca_fusiformis.AAC.6
MMDGSHPNTKKNAYFWQCHFLREFQQSLEGKLGLGVYSDHVGLRTYPTSIRLPILTRHTIPKSYHFLENATSNTSRRVDAELVATSPGQRMHGDMHALWLRAFSCVSCSPVGKHALIYRHAAVVPHYCLLSIVWKALQAFFTLK